MVLSRLRRPVRRAPAPFAPVRVLEIDITEGLPALRSPGPARLLVRHAGRPVAFIPVTIPAAGLAPQEIGAVIAAWPGDGRPGPPGAASWQRPLTGPVETRHEGAPTTSVVVTTCVASATLGLTLDSLRRQQLPPTEILVVDNRPATSGVAAFLRASAFAGVTLVEEMTAGLSRARNAGLGAARGEVVAFLDDDVVVDRGWLAAVVDAFGDPEVACVTGLILPLELQTPAQCWFEEFGGFSKGFQRRRFNLGPDLGEGALYPYAAGVFGTGANSAFRTAALRQLGGFDETLGMGTPARGGEDLDIHLSVVQAGLTLMYEPAALIWHRHHRDGRSLRRQIHDYGIGMSAMVTKRWVAHPNERRELAARLLAGLRHLMHPASPKHTGKSRSYPGVLTLVELAGVLQGPFAYWQSRRRS